MTITIKDLFARSDGCINNYKTHYKSNQVEAENGLGILTAPELDYVLLTKFTNSDFLFNFTRMFITFPVRLYVAEILLGEQAILDAAVSASIISAGHKYLRNGWFGNFPTERVLECKFGEGLKDCIALSP